MAYKPAYEGVFEDWIIEMVAESMDMDFDLCVECLVASLMMLEI